MSSYLDFSTAEAALHSIAEAYRRKDIEAAVACKDFVAEAKLMLQRLGEYADDLDMVKQTAEALELSFRSHTQGNWPDFSSVSSTVAELTLYRENIFVAREVGTYNGSRFEQAIYMAKLQDGWRVLNPVPVKDTTRRVKPWWKFW